LANPAEDRLLNKLLRSRPHNPKTIPVSDVGQTVHVKLGLGIQKIIQVVRSAEYYKMRQLKHNIAKEARRALCRWNIPTAVP